MDIVNEYLKRTFVKCKDINNVKMRPCMYCKDGFDLSIQASKVHHCVPEISFDENKEFIPYEKVEIASCTFDEIIENYVDYPIDSIYVAGYVPVKEVEKIIEKHGGINYDKIRLNIITRFVESIDGYCNNIRNFDLAVYVMENFRPDEKILDESKSDDDYTPRELRELYYNITNMKEKYS